MSIIDQFLRQYEREYDYYFGVAQLTANRCETALADAGVRQLTTFRVKKPDRLRDKLIQRDSSKHYSDVEDIRNDIVDFAGVRIALYFPADQKSAEDFIEDNFDVEPGGRKSFPPAGAVSSATTVTKTRFPGYCATHFRVRNRVSDLDVSDRRFSEARVEIQVASVLMLAWQEVNHDLAYKTLSGPISDDEQAILDEVNGLVIAGEIAFERLQRASERRLAESNAKFGSHYDLAAYVHRRAREGGS